MKTYQVIINKTVRTFQVNVTGIKWMTQSGGGQVTSDNVSQAVDLFTASTPQSTDYIILGGKKKGLISALITLIRNDFNGVFSPVDHNHNGTYQPVGDYATNTELSGKQDKETGKGLSQENYTTAEKEKLAGLESSHYKGRFTNLAALQSAIPTATAGDYARVDGGVGVDVVTYIWDDSDNAWVQEKGTGTTETAASVKTKYESNPDTNAFTDSLKAKLVAFTANFTSELKTAYDNAVTWIGTNGANILNHLSDSVAHITAVERTTWNGKANQSDITALYLLDSREYQSRRGVIEIVDNLRTTTALQPSFRQALSSGTAVARGDGLIVISCSTTANSGFRFDLLQNVPSVPHSFYNQYDFVFSITDLTNIYLKGGFMSNVITDEIRPCFNFKITAGGNIVTQTYLNAINTNQLVVPGTSTPFTTLVAGTVYHIRIKPTASSITFEVYNTAGVLIANYLATTQIPTGGGSANMFGTLMMDTVGVTAREIVRMYHHTGKLNAYNYGALN